MIRNCWMCRRKTKQKKYLSLGRWEGRYQCEECGCLNSEDTWKARTPSFVIVLEGEK